MRTALKALAAVAFVAAPSLVRGEIKTEVVRVGNPGNPADTSGLGSTSYEFFMSKYVVTNDEYALFLNAVARNGDPFALYHPGMAFHRLGGITRRGAGTSASPFSYHVKPGMGRMPVNFVSYFDTIRFANWMTNGYLMSGTEWGSYTITGGGPDSGSVGPRTGNGPWVVPTEDEWYKAAYYDPAKAGTGGYWQYATRRDEGPVSSGRAIAGMIVEIGGLFSELTSAYGTVDQWGNVREWTESQVGGEYVLRGVVLTELDKGKDQSRTLVAGSYADAFTGFRIARISTITGEPVSRLGLGSLRQDILDTGFGGIGVTGMGGASRGGGFSGGGGGGSGGGAAGVSDSSMSQDTPEAFPVPTFPDSPKHPIPDITDGSDDSDPPSDPPVTPEPATGLMLIFGAGVFLHSRRR
ncbi:MAG TPA: SUMF1/EgtB/PvdO family nonheme iron enzyme [Phycisphaerae bacterium]|nr:SUMF1/EgtB/PvdO family nonheme iron enzyme [Phycisphaerae bacterium]HSA26897.1 SUMF1/EgtB/PvdO family nonheme iron enzyme [Phycisphaerae bacterium]